MESRLEEIRDKYIECRRLNLQAHLSYEDTEIVFQKIAETYTYLEQILIGVATMDTEDPHKSVVVDKIKNALQNLRE